MIRLASAPAIVALALLCPTCAEPNGASMPDAPAPSTPSNVAARRAIAESAVTSNDVVDDRQASPCYAEKHDATCGAPTRWKAKTCYWKNDCRMKEFGAGESLPDFESTKTWHAAAPIASPCADYFARTDSGWTNADPENFGRASLGYSHEEKTETWLPDDPSASYGPGTQTCKAVYRGVVRYRTFGEYNVSRGGALDDYADNPCPSNEAAPFACFDHDEPTDWPACRKPEFGLDPNPAACGPVSPPPSVAWHAADVDERSGLYASSATDALGRRAPSLN